MRHILYCCAIALVTPVAHAQTYPIKPVRIISPYSPGGLGDLVPRAVAVGLTESLGQQVIVENRPGASQIIGMQAAARSPADGYTLVFGSVTSLAINPSAHKNLPYDAVKDFAPVALCVTTPLYLVVHPSVPAKSVKELVALAKAKPNTLNFASGGNGSSPHLSGELLKLVTGIQITHIPYKGSGPGITDLLGGHVQLMFAGPLGVEQHIKGGRLRALAVADARRSVVLPDVPTMAEGGVAGVETGTWYGMLAPARTPPPVIETVYRAIAKVLQLPDLKARLLAQGVDIVASPPQQFAAFLRSEVAKWAKVVKDAKVQAN